MSIKLKFTLLIIVFIIILVSVLTYLSITRQTSLLSESTEKRIRVIMMNAADTIEEALISADDLLISTTIKKLKERNEDIEQVFLIDKDANLVFHSDNDVMNKVFAMGITENYKENKTVLQAFQSSDFLKQMEINKALYSYPIIDNNIRLGTLFVKFSFIRIINNIKQTEIRLIGISLGILILFIFITYFFTSILIKPVKLLAKGAEIIGSGDLEYKIVLKQRDELGFLAERFNTMTNELKISRKKVIEKELFEKDLEIASEIQHFLIPENIPPIMNLNINAVYKPARFVGGDYYDVIPISDKQYGFIIVDVAGKGSGAAIIMSMITSIVHSEAYKTIDSSKLMISLNNKLIKRLPVGSFATGIYLIYDIEKEIIQYTNAGHSNMLLYHQASHKVFELSKAGDLPLGITENTQYTRAAFHFEKGDVILLQTDGVYEAKSMDDKEFSYNRVKEILLNMAKNNQPDKINQNIIDEINQFMGNRIQHDDITLLTIKKL